MHFLHIMGLAPNSAKAPRSRHYNGGTVEYACSNESRQMEPTIERGTIIYMTAAKWIGSGRGCSRNGGKVKRDRFRGSVFPIVKARI